jgi:hypothetical protein
LIWTGRGKSGVWVSSIAIRSGWEDGGTGLSRMGQNKKMEKKSINPRIVIIFAIALIQSSWLEKRRMQ